jgi:hypothetical protein
VQQYGGVPPYHETRAYVARIVRDYNRKKIAQRRAAAAAAKNNRKQKALPQAVASGQAAMPAALDSPASR